MSRILAFFVAVTALLFLFTFAQARGPLDLRGNDVTSIDDRLVDLPESDPKDTATLPVNDVNSSDNRLAYLPESDTKETATIVLPSEKHESEPATLGEVESEEVESSESKLPGKEISTSKPIQEESETKKVETVPLTVISFRPINRHFLQRPLFPFRPGHRCHGRHQHHNQFKPWGGLRFKSHRDLSLANDMLLSGGEDLGFDPVTRGRPHQIPARWTRFNHGGSRFSIIKDESREEMIKWPHHRRHHHHHHDEERGEHEHEHDHDHEHEHEHEHAHEHGFMKKIRKFLNHF